MSNRLDTVLERLNGLIPPMETSSPTPTGDEAPSVTVAIPAGCERVEFNRLGYDLRMQLLPEQIVPAAKILDEEGFSIDMVTGVDWPDENQLELVYDFMHFHCRARVALRTRIPRDKPEMPSLASVFAGANWHERETAEFFGINFTGHPNLIHLLLPEDMEGYPLRKDFQPHA